MEASPGCPAASTRPCLPAILGISHPTLPGLPPHPLPAPADSCHVPRPELQASAEMIFRSACKPSLAGPQCPPPSQGARYPTSGPFATALGEGGTLQAVPARNWRMETGCASRGRFDRDTYICLFFCFAFKQPVCDPLGMFQNCPCDSGRSCCLRSHARPWLRPPSRKSGLGTVPRPRRPSALLLGPQRERPRRPPPRGGKSFTKILRSHFLTWASPGLGSGVRPSTRFTAETARLRERVMGLCQL